jgi:hypothetical protein
MSDSGGIPELQYCHPDGVPKTRLEMDQWLRKEVPKVHWLRIHACRTLNLPKQISWGMQEIILRHWMLDEMVRRQLIIGSILGVNATSYNDETELRQFAQRLTAMIQAGQAVQPQQAEGIDMSGYTPPPPPVMGGAPQQPSQPSAYPSGPPGPPPPPPGVPMGPPGYQPQQAQPQYAPTPQAPAPMGPPGYQQPAGPPMGPPSMGPPGVPPAGPPPSAPPQAPSAPGRRKREVAPGAPPPPAAPVPSMGPPPSGPPAGFAPAGYSAPAAPPGFGPPPAPQVQMSQPVAAAPSIDVSALAQKIDQLLGVIGELRNENAHILSANAAAAKDMKLLSMITVLLLRGVYQTPGNSEAADLLKELGYQIPQ